MNNTITSFYNNKEILNDIKYKVLYLNHTYIREG